MNRKAKITLLLALGLIVVMAFRVSWNALRDVATAIGADAQAAILYPLVVDGLMAVALVAGMVLDGSARKLAFRVLGAYTLASLGLNHLHGIMPELHQPEGTVGLAWPLVLLATALPVGAIFFGSDLVARLLRTEAVGTGLAQRIADTRMDLIHDLPAGTAAGVRERRTLSAYAGQTVTSADTINRAMADMASPVRTEVHMIEDDGQSADNAQVKPTDSVRTPRKRTPSLADIKAAAADIADSGAEVTGRTLADYFDVAARTGQRYADKLRTADSK
ncbi:DUF2637 domain-containing protein [Streptomyces lycii]|uniref:DUF2637 domain-containing protein n=1 Tax=Streptomyces lycii TaxID=2654337 RepID=A0ABQ7FHZ2_9ACTN|nr:DUF2637 domain-containing protein [Streptomyces lycii]KAF4408616.1 DUF2637 domain-containing protein [Streptomyces lycii]